MANITTIHAKNLLDWGLGGASPSAPGARWLGLASGQPTSQASGGAAAASEIPNNVGYSRSSALFGPAASPAGSASITAAITFSFNAAATAIGCHIWDGSPVNSSNALWYGNLAAARTMAIGDQLVFLPGALTITLA